MKKTLQRMRKLRASELALVMQDYRQHLAGWRLIGQDCLGREQGPVLQVIGFERHSWRAYRPMGFVRILVAPGGGGLNRLLLSLELGLHAHQMLKMLEAMRREFIPSIDAPLVPEEVLELCEREAIPSSPEAYSLAALNAYLGHYDRALCWCRRFPELVDPRHLGWQEWDIEQRDFLVKLEAWIHAGEAREQLEPVLEAERKKWNLA